MSAINLAIKLESSHPRLIQSRDINRFHVLGTERESILSVVITRQFCLWMKKLRLDSVMHC